MIIAFIVLAIFLLLFVVGGTVSGKTLREPCSICKRQDYRNGGEYNGKVYCTKVHLDKLIAQENREKQWNENLNDFLSQKSDYINKHKPA